MNQASLFEPERVARAELCRAIEYLDLARASRKLEEFQQIWPEAPLSWEPELVRIGLPLSRRRLDFDSGYRVWKNLESQLAPLEVPSPRAAAIRRHFFSRLLAANRGLFEELRTPAGRSLGDFYLLADQPKNARRRYEQELRRLGERWELRLRLGDCNYRLGHSGAARSNYHWSFLLGLPEESWKSIEDDEFLARLRQAEEACWAFPETCACGEIPSARFSSRRDFEEFKSTFAPGLTESDAARSFSFYWVVSENKVFCPDRELLEARRQMKALNSRLHARNMQRIR